MTLISLIGLLIVAWIFSLILRLPLIIYSALNNWVGSTLVLSSCGICKTKWADLSSDEGTFSHDKKSTYKVLVNQETEWKECGKCNGRGTVDGASIHTDFPTAGDPVTVHTGFYQKTCPKCGGTGGKDLIISQEFEDREITTNYYNYVISCGDCGKKYTKQGTKKPIFPNSKKTVFVANMINQGLVKGMLAGLILALVGTIIWGIVELIDLGFSFPSLAEGIMGVNIFFAAAIIASLIGIPIGAMWGSIIFLLSPLIALLASKKTYLHSALSGGLSLALIIFFADMFIDSFNTDFTSDLNAVYGYAIIIGIGAIALCIAKPALDWLEDTL